MINEKTPKYYDVNNYNKIFFKRIIDVSVCLPAYYVWSSCFEDVNCGSDNERMDDVISMCEINMIKTCG